MPKNAAVPDPESASSGSVAEGRALGETRLDYVGVGRHGMHGGYLVGDERLLAGAQLLLLDDLDRRKGAISLVAASVNWFKG